MFNLQKPTVQMLGRWQPWHDGHTALFKKALSLTGQVVIMIRNTEREDSNPFPYETVIKNIKKGLFKEGFKYEDKYIIIVVPNIVDISYGRGVGYTFTEHDLGADIHKISATDIRKKLKQKGEL